MDLKEAIKKRSSIRSFLDKKPDEKIIHEIIEYAHLAPSAGNMQARDFIIIDDDNTKRKLSLASLNQEFVYEAPYDIVVCANLDRISSYGHRGKDLYSIQGSAAVVEHILLLAVEYGLGTCWVGAFNEKKVSEILDLPSQVRPIAIIPIGYPRKESKSTSRIDTKKLIHYNKW